MHRHEQAFLHDLEIRLSDLGIALELECFGLGTPRRLSTYLQEKDAVLPDMIVSTDLEVFENKALYERLEEDLLPAGEMLETKPSIAESSIAANSKLLPYLIIPMACCYKQELCIPHELGELIEVGIPTIMGGYNNSGATSIVKALWSEFGQDAIERYARTSQVADMPIQSFHAVRQGSERVSICPLLYAKRADNEVLRMHYPTPGAPALPSYIAARQSIDPDVAGCVMEEMRDPEFMRSFAENASIEPCAKGSVDERTCAEHELQFLYPNQAWFDAVDSQSFFELFNSIERV